jgi:hypothetical protein
MSIDKIIEQIEIELKNRDGTKREIVVAPKRVYSYSDFTQYSDREFVKRTFRDILGREVDREGLEYYLKLLRSQEQTKKEIITAIRYTKEGREIGVTLLGSKREYIFSLIKKIPILGLIFEWILLILYLPRYIKREKKVIKSKDKFEQFYIEFEDKFRGTKEEIKDKLSIYIPYIKEVAKSDDTIVDIGCGRGEWIEILSQNGFNHIRVLDSNSILVESSQSIVSEIIYGY